jgi:hypothetical protein
MHASTNPIDKGTPMTAERTEPLVCSKCNMAPGDSTAKIIWVRGWLVMSRFTQRHVVGCNRCVRRRLLREAGASLLLGWFSPTAIVCNPFLILRNLYLGLTVKPDPEAVARLIREHEGGEDRNAD